MAAVVDIEECAVWKVATENAEVTSLLLISSPASSFPVPAGLIVSTEERDGRLLA